MMVANKRSKKEGSVYFRESDGLWVGAFEVSGIGNGKRRRKVVLVNPKGMTPAQARAATVAKMNAARTKLAASGDLPDDKQTFEQWLWFWYRDIQLPKISKKTADTYRTLLEQHIIPTIGQVPVRELTAAHVRRVGTAIIGKGLSSTTANQAHRIMAVALKYALREKRVTENVATLTDAPRRARRTLTVLTAEDAFKVMETVAGERLSSRIAAAFYTGGRQGELLGLELDRVTDRLDFSWQLQRFIWEHGCNDECGHKRAAECPVRTVTLPSGADNRYLQNGFWLSRPKSAAGTRIIHLVEPLRGLIEHRIFEGATEANPHGLLWTADPKMGKDHKTMQPVDGTPIDPSWDNRNWHDALKRAGVPDARLHDARHVTASLLMAAKVPDKVLQTILGHSTFAMSQKYMNVNDVEGRSAMDAISARLSGEQTG